MKTEMTYRQARCFISEAAKNGSVLGLESIRHLMRVLGDVQEQLPVIHIGGTNGKGSVGAFLDSIFREAGLHVGRYCSPAVFSPLEVWQYDGTNITETEYANVMSQVRAACDIVVSEGGTMPTVFEIETAAAFIWFDGKKTDVLLLEVGMGGQLDATNLITRPLCSVITTISFDHMQFLGDTIEQIAKVKSGIIKKGCPVYSAPQQPQVEDVLCGRAKEAGSLLGMVKKENIRLICQEPGRMEFFYKELRLATKMAGSCQLLNASLAAETALHMLPVLKKHIGKMQKLPYIVEGVAKARWKGRFEVLGEHPLFVIDGAHNEDAALQLAKTVEMCFTNEPLTYIIGVLEDKEHEKMLKIMLPYAKRVYTVTPDHCRAMDGKLLCREAGRFHPDVRYCRNVAQAVQKALSDGGPVLAFGSLSYLGELRRCYESMK